jgi:redox-sensitive bicupin YhaK (pirin superfamily)
MRLIAGSAYGTTAPTAVFSPLFYLAADCEAGATVGMPDEHRERAVYVVEGEVEAGGESFGVGHMIVFEPGAPVSLRAVAPARLMLLGGAPLDGPRHVWWNFVSSSEQRIERAKVDWREERFAAVPGDDERIPLPER